MRSNPFKSAAVKVCSLWMFFLWALPALAQDAQAPTFEQQARQVLRSHLQQAKELQVGELLEELARETRLPREEVQARLSAWLDTLEGWRKQHRSEWEKLVNSGGAQTRAREAERFLRQFLGQARQALEKQTDRPLEDLVEQAAKKAELLTYQGRDLLLSLLSEPVDRQLPDKVGLLVEVRNLMGEDHGLWSYRNAAGEWVWIHEANLHEFLLPVLVDELSASTRVRWAIGQPKSGLQPDWRLVLELEKLDGSLLTGQVILSDLKTQEEFYRRSLQVNYRYSEDLSSQERGDKFLGNIALKTREIFEGFWAGR